MKLSPISMLAIGIVLLALVGGGAYYFGINKGRQATEEAGEPRQIPVMGQQANWTTAATFGNWQLRCRDNTEGKKVCIGVLEVVNTKNRQLILGWLVGLNAKGGLSTTLQTPTGVLVGRGVDMQLGSSAVRHIGYSACGARGCEASSTMDDTFVNDLVGADKATITLYTDAGKALNIGIPVKGADQIVKSFQQ